jgi:predicted DNA-binding transcriptional regulator YafY
MKFVILILILISVSLIIYFIAKEITKKRTDSNKIQQLTQKAKSQVETNKASTKTQSKEPYSTIRFMYRDRDGKKTERTVDVITGKRGETFRAFCHLRKEERTFFFNRIVGAKVIDLVSGETLTPMEWRYRLQGTQVALSELERERESMRATNNYNA